jgi:hypothetical protein
MPAVRIREMPGRLQNKLPSLRSGKQQNFYAGLGVDGIAMALPPKSLWQS